MSSPQSESQSTEDFGGIATQWSLVLLAHQGSVSAAGPARNELVLKYRRAIRAYLGAMLRDDHAADELTQEVILRLLSGDFAGATPEKGRFRNYLKVAVRNMARSYWQERQRRAATAVDAAELAVAASEDSTDDTVWDYDWRSALLNSTWVALRQFESSSPGNVFHAVLKLRSEFPDFNSTELAQRLSEQTGTTYTASNVRQQLRRAKFRFAQLLVQEIASSLDWPLPDEVEQELVDLGLIKYVREFLPADWKESGQLRDPAAGSDPRRPR
jgi:RNA polymerase sigma factor (sigma-70 family)